MGLASTLVGGASRRQRGLIALVTVIMSNWQQSPGISIAKPGKALTAVMGGLFLIWLMFAIAINWADASLELFMLFCGSTEHILAGEVWRLFTAPLMHFPQGDIGHILWVLVGLFFLTPALEQRWGAGRLLRFLFFSSVIAYGFQFLASLVLPAGVAGKLVPPYWFGGFPVLEAVAIAWAASFKNQTVRLMFVLPVSATTLIWFVVAMSVLRVIAGSNAPEGLLSPFGGMLSGWLLGSGTPSPMRRLYLKFKLQQVETEAKRERERRDQRVKGSPFEVIEGGRSEKKRGARGPDGRWLN